MADELAMKEMGLVVAGLLVDDRGRVLAARRSYPVELAGRWEFPGGKIEPGETPQQGLERELAEELGIRATVEQELPGPEDGCWPINDRLRMRAYWCSFAGRPVLHDGGHDALVWTEPERLADHDWLPADVALAAAVTEHLSGLVAR